MEKTLLITDKNGKGIVTVVTTDPTLVVNTPAEQVIDATNLPEETKKELKSKPEEFDKHLKKVKKEK